MFIHVYPPSSPTLTLGIQNLNSLHTFSYILYLPYCNLDRLAFPILYQHGKLQRQMDSN